MKPSAKIAIITRTLNRPLLLSRAIKSVLAQTEGDWIHIIINDGGGATKVDDLINKNKAAYQERVHVIHNKTSGGMEAASNKAISSCKSDYIVIHDDDDAWHKDFLQKTTEILNDNNIPDLGGVICHSQKIVEEIKGNKITEISSEPFNNGVKEITLWRLAGGNLFPPISFIYKRSIYQHIDGMYNEELPVLGDWEFNIRFLQESEIVVLPETLAYYYHRLPSKSKSDVYANSIVNGSNKHDFYYTYLRNSFLREDLDEGKLGIGHLVNLSYDLRTSSEKQDKYMLAAQESEKIRINVLNAELTKNAAKQHEVVMEAIRNQSEVINNKIDHRLIENKSILMQLHGLFKPLIWLGIKLKLIKIK